MRRLGARGAPTPAADRAFVGPDLAGDLSARMDALARRTVGVLETPGKLEAAPVNHLAKLLAVVLDKIVLLREHAPPPNDGEYDPDRLTLKQLETSDKLSGIVMGIRRVRTDVIDDVQPGPV